MSFTGKQFGSQMPKIYIHKADPLNAIINPIEIEISGVLPSSVERRDGIFNADAELIVDALFRYLPGETLDRIMEKMSERIKNRSLGNGGDE